MVNMAVHPIDYRYGSREMKNVFEEERKLEKMLLVEAALAGALADLGKIPRKDADKIILKANTKDVKLERVKEIEKETKHDVMALVKALTEICGESGKYVHLTATSYDIFDTANALILKDGLEILLKEGKELLKTCLNISAKYKDLVMIGRTHGQHAIPITLGLKFALFSNKIGDNLIRLEYDMKNYVLGKFSGAVGNYASQKIYDLGDELETRIMKKLGIRPAEITTQVVDRENFARILCDIAILACSVEQIAKEIRNLQRTEIGELSEPFGKKQVGSSTMAQKRNPINTENICSNVKVIRSCVYPALENIALEHERDLTNSAAERSIVPTAFILADDVLTRMNRVLSGLVVSPENIKKNLDMSRGTIMSEAIITKLVERGMGRQDAHELLRLSSMQAFEKDVHLKDILLTKKINKYLTSKELEELFNHKKYIGSSLEKTEKIIEKWKKWLNANN
jgi:adenylosuccinate lyase